MNGLENILKDSTIMLSVGTLRLEAAQKQLTEFYTTRDISFNIVLTEQTIDEKHVNILFDIIKNKASKTFNFTYVFNNPPSSPYFPSANYTSNGFAIGLQPTNLSLDCKSIVEWLKKMKEVWEEINQLFNKYNDFLGIDSSIVPLNDEKGSFVGFIKRLGFDFSYSTTTSIYLEITKYIKENNPKPVGLCGMMLPCLEDLDLAQEYQADHFSIERNLFLSLQSGLGIDTYPIGIDEKPMRIIEVLKLVQGLSNKYKKSLSVRFVSDGKAKIGEKTNFQNQYLQDVVVRAL